MAVSLQKTFSVVVFLTDMLATVRSLIKHLFVYNIDCVDCVTD
jgi:hypothetical protein